MGALTTEATPGWRVDDERDGRLRWWTGSSYSESTVYAALLGRHVRWASALAVLLVVLLVWVGWLDLVAAQVHRDFLHVMHTPSFFDQPYYDEKLDVMQQRADLVRLQTAGSMALVAVVLAGWQFRLASLPPATTLRSQPEWHVGAWFVPVLNLWAPLRNLLDLWRALVPRRSAAVRVLLWVWWLVWLVSFVAWIVSFPSLITAESDARVEQVFRWVVVGKLAGVLAAAGAIAVVVVFTVRARAFARLRD